MFVITHVFLENIVILILGRSGDVVEVLVLRFDF